MLFSSKINLMILVLHYFAQTSASKTYFLFIKFLVENFQFPWFTDP